jgi:hypothetical protein
MLFFEAPPCLQNRLYRPTLRKTPLKRPDMIVSELKRFIYASCAPRYSIQPVDRAETGQVAFEIFLRITVKSTPLLPTCIFAIEATESIKNEEIF